MNLPYKVMKIYTEKLKNIKKLKQVSQELQLNDLILRLWRNLISIHQNYQTGAQNLNKRFLAEQTG